MKLTIRLFPIFACLALLSTPASGQKAPNGFNTFNPRFEVFELPGGVLGNSVQGIVQTVEGYNFAKSKTFNIKRLTLAQNDYD